MTVTELAGKRRLPGRRVLITGGVRRLGLAIAEQLAAEGADIVVASREPSGEAAANALGRLSAHGVRAYSVQCDVTDPASVTAAVAQAVDLLGGLDVLVNNAGAFEAAALEDLTPEQWDAMYATNTRGPFLVAQAALPALRAARGRIINIGSLGGIRPWPTHGHYCASKAALHMLTGVMARAWAPEVSVNCVAPGMIQMAGEPERMAGKTPMCRDGRADEVAGAVLYFATASEFVTGQVLAVDGALGLA